jgi:hypothetical protein
MKIDFCLTATNTKSIYLNQIPNFVKVWLLLEIQPRIILIHHEIPLNFKEYEPYIILFDPVKYKLEDLQTAYIAQNIRILYPALFPSEKTIMISDIDIMPISRNFFIDHIKSMPDTVFINYRRYNEQLNICYNVAQSSTWSTIFGIKTIEEVVEQLHKNYNKDYNSNKNCPGWFSDQEVLTKMVMEYYKYNPTEVIFFDTLGFKINRLDKRDRKEIITNKLNIIKNIGIYTDFHITSKNQRYIDLSEEINKAILKYLSESKKEFQLHEL